MSTCDIHVAMLTCNIIYTGMSSHKIYLCYAMGRLSGVDSDRCAPTPLPPPPTTPKYFHQVGMAANPLETVLCICWFFMVFFFKYIFRQSLGS